LIGFPEKADIKEAIMRKASAVALLLLMVISAARADSLELAPPPGNWNKVQSLPPNASIKVRLKHGTEIDGEFIRLTDNSILVMEYGREKNYPQNAVAWIQWMRPGSRARNAAIIGGIFFGIGFGLGYAAAAQIADQNSMPAGERAGAGAAIGGVLGGAAAAISLAHRPGPRGEVIYKAR
jgi:hypothetical protein